MKKRFLEENIQSLSREIAVEIRDSYEFAIDTLRDLSEEFRDFCRKEELNDFDFSTSTEFGHTYANNDEDYDIFLDIITLKEIRDSLDTSEVSSEDLNLLAKYIFIAGIGILEEKVSKMVSSKDWRTSLNYYDWFKDILLGKDNWKALKDFIEECKGEAILMAEDYEEEEILSLLQKVV